MRFRILPIVVACVVAACSKAADTSSSAVANKSAIPDGSDPVALVAALDSATMATMEQRTGNWQDADASSDFRARLSEGKVRVIDERMIAGENSSRRITHYFTDQEKLASSIEFRIQTVTGTDRPAAKQFVLIKLDFRGDSAIRAEKTVDGDTVPMLTFEIDNARKHSLDLLAIAKTGATTTPAKP